MTGPYSAFKGKLKVGDRVRLEGSKEPETVLEVGEIGFRLEGYTYSYMWDLPFTLELLTPSPVVPEEEPMDEDFKNLLTVFLEDLRASMRKLDDKLDGVLKKEPSPAAEDEEEWWVDWMRDRDLSMVDWVGQRCPDGVREIVREAERRGAEKALRKAGARRRRSLRSSPQYCR